MLLYLSGPMTGMDEWNYPAFTRAAARLRELGFDVLNPAETAGGVTHLPRETFMRVDVGYVMAADAVVVMEGWRNSAGSKLEAMLAASLNTPVFTYDPKQGLDALVELTDWAVSFELHQCQVDLSQLSAPPSETAPEPGAEEEAGVIHLFPGPPEYQ